MTDQDRFKSLQGRAKETGCTLLGKLHGERPWYVILDPTGLPVARGTLSTVELCPILSQAGNVDYPGP